jgi:tetratricopeptide (TPR) repeat protein/transcriptional regulator with XRE-family HTH domain
MAASEIPPFAQLLRRHRRERGLTQEALAEAAGLSARGIRALEQGERTLPHADTMQLLADALQLSPSDRIAFEAAARPLLPRGASVHRNVAPPVGSFLGARPSGPLVARERELANVLGLVEDVEHSAGRLAMLAGEPGVGKTRLAQEVMLRLEERGFLIATGQCYEPERAVPYYPFLDALTAAARSAPPSLGGEIPNRWPHLERLLPDRGVRDRDGDSADHDVQQVLFWAVSGFLEALAGIQPIALLLDDLHWADASTLKLFQHLARHLRADRVLLLGTYRDVEVGKQQPLEGLLRDLHRDGLLREVVVRRLSRDGTAALTAAILGETDIPSEFAELLYRHTDGNPFFTQEVVRALVERGDVFLRDGIWDRQPVQEIEVPRSIRSAIGERVSRLGHQTQEVLHEASVLGQAFPFDDLWRMGKRPEDELDEALEEALGANLVRVTGPDEYAFNHALTQQTLYAELSPRKRNRLHTAVGEALEQQPESTRRRRAAQIAWHFLQAGSRERALPSAMLAGDEAEAVFAHGEAEQHYRTALDLARGLGDRPREAEALEKMGVVLRMVSRYDEALTLLERAAKLSADAGDHEAEARATHEIGFVHFHRGTPGHGIERVQGVTERLEQLPSSVQPYRALADLYSALALDLWPLARYTEVLSATQRAAELALPQGYTRPRALSETLRGMAVAMIGPLPEARRVFEEAAAISEASGNRWWVADGVGDIGRVCLDEGKFREGREYLERSHALIEALHDGAELAWIESNLGEASYVVGDWTNARAEYEGAVRTARRADAAMYLSYALLHLAELCASEGNWEKAKQHIDEGLPLGQQCGAVPAVRKGQRLLAENDLAEGRAAQAVNRLQPLLASPEGAWPRAFPPPVLIEAYLELGDVARAEGLVLQRVQRFRAQNHRRALAVWLRVQGMTLGHQHRWKESEQLFAEAVLLAQAISYPYAEGRSHYQYGRLHLQRGEQEEARDRLAQAQAIFRRLGAGKDMVWTEQALTTLDRSSGATR